MANSTSDENVEQSIITREVITTFEEMRDGQTRRAELVVECHAGGAVVIFEEGEQLLLLPPAMREAIQELFNELYEI